MKLRQEIEHLTPALRRLARALVSGRLHASTDAGDDLVHEVLLRALKFEEPVRGLATAHWLYAILIGIHRQQVRDRHASRANESGSAQKLRHTQSGSLRHPQQRSHQSRFPALVSETDSEILGALDSLDLEEREALLLVVLEGLGYGEAAAILGLPRPALVARLARARAHLASHGRSAPQARPEISAHLRLVK